VPAPPVARLLRITGPGRQIDIFSHRQLQRWAAGYREHRRSGQLGHQSRSREWTAARQMGPGDTPGCLVGCPACSRGRGQRARVGFRLCPCGEAAKAAWALDAPGLPEAARVRLPPGDLDSVSGRARLYYRRAAEPVRGRDQGNARRPADCAPAEAQLRDPCS
jgi:hypothetical protein